MAQLTTKADLLSAILLIARNDVLTRQMWSLLGNVLN